MSFGAIESSTTPLFRIESSNTRVLIYWPKCAKQLEILVNNRCKTFFDTIWLIIPTHAIPGCPIKEVAAYLLPGHSLVDSSFGSLPLRGFCLHLFITSRYDLHFVTKASHRPSLAMSYAISQQSASQSFSLRAHSQSFRGARGQFLTEAPFD